MFAMAKYQQPDPLQYWYQMQQQQQQQQQEGQQNQQQQLEQQGYMKKNGCNCGGNKKKNQ
ncbi:cytochrome C oxidase subunit III [Bacillus cytotoxicus]|uniref:Cytochrome C oxidase subunit III n=1 Tax=Bacillus cytotoxicus TaxID=580165 RepID=A0ACC6A2Z9_9BACI|nr:cytochrome C oxidase subunit III [Bacillus cytotoxicus]